MSTEIHPSAVVDPAVNLGVEVRVGPYAMIEAGCVIGDYCEVRAHAVICKGTLMGPHNQIGYGAVIGAEPQDYAYKGGRSWVEIGSGNKIREYVTIHRATTEGTATTIGNGTILANNTLLAGYVEVEDGVFLGGGTVVHQHARIGTLAITRGGTRVGKDVPPYFMAVDVNEVSGINRIGLRRAGLSHETRRAIQAAFELLYRSNLNVTQAVEELRHKFHVPEIAHLVDFIRKSKRGICRGYRDRHVEDED